MVPLLLAASAVIGTASMIYNMSVEDPRAEMAQHLRALQLEAVRNREAQARFESGMRKRFSQTRTGRLQDLLNMKQGLSSGSISPFELGIQGGGLANRDMPLVKMVAAKLGMDPADLAARFDPRRSNAFIPRDMRGNRPRPTAKQLAVAETASIVPPNIAAQLTPNQVNNAQ